MEELLRYIILEETKVLAKDIYNFAYNNYYSIYVSFMVLYNYQHRLHNITSRKNIGNEKNGVGMAK